MSRRPAISQDDYGKIGHQFKGVKMTEEQKKHALREFLKQEIEIKKTDLMYLEALLEMVNRQ